MFDNELHGYREGGEKRNFYPADVFGCPSSKTANFQISFASIFRYTSLNI